LGQEKTGTICGYSVDDEHRDHEQQEERERGGAQR